MAGNMGVEILLHHCDKRNEGKGAERGQRERTERAGRGERTERGEKMEKALDPQTAKR